MEKNEFIGHEPCPDCGSSDGLARYKDGHGWCFAGCQGKKRYKDKNKNLDNRDFSCSLVVRPLRNTLGVPKVRSSTVINEGYIPMKDIPKVLP